MGRDSSDSESDSSSSSSSSRSRSRSRENKKRKRDKKEKKKSSKKLKTEKKSKKDKKDKKDKRSKKDGKKGKEDSVTARLRKSMLEAFGGKTTMSDEEKKAMLLEQNKDKLTKKVNLKDRTGMLDKASAVMKGAKGPMSADQAKAYDIHMDQMKGGHGGGNRAPTTY